MSERAWRRGYRAFTTGRPCPYNKYGWAWEDWHAGYKQAERDANSAPGTPHDSAVKSPEGAA